MVNLTASLAIWRRYGRASVGNRILSVGLLFGTTPVVLFPLMTVWRLRVCVFCRAASVRIRFYFRRKSGAIGVGLLWRVDEQYALSGSCHRLQLDASAHVLLISTEGDTSPDIYEDIVPGTDAVPNITTKN